MQSFGDEVKAGRKKGRSTGPTANGRKEGET